MRIQILCLALILILALPANAQWAIRAGGSNDDGGEGIAVDPFDNCYVTGSFSSATISFGTITLSNNGDNDIFIVKYDACGDVVWATSVGGAGNDFGVDIVADGSGNSFVTGSFGSQTITFGSTPALTNNGGLDFFIVKFDPSGNAVWSAAAGGSMLDIGYGIVVDQTGNAYAAGSFSSPTMSIGSTPPLTNNGNFDVFMAKYDVNGSAVWSFSVGGTENDLGNNIGIDGYNNLYITGMFASSSITFGSTTLVRNGLSRNLFVAKYDANANAAWASSAGPRCSGYDIAVDGVGNSYIAGSFDGPSITFGSTTLNNNGANDIFVAKYNSSGGVIWASQAGGQYDEEGSEIAVDHSGKVYVAGIFESPTIAFGSIILTNHGAGDVFVAKYDAAGNTVEAISSGGGSADYPNDIGVQANGNAYVTGRFYSSSITLASTVLSNAGGGDVFFGLLPACEWSSPCPIGDNDLDFGTYNPICSGGPTPYCKTVVYDGVVSPASCMVPDESPGRVTIYAVPNAVVSVTSVLPANVVDGIGHSIPLSNYTAGWTTQSNICFLTPFNPQVPNDFTVGADGTLILQYGARACDVSTLPVTGHYTATIIVTWEYVGERAGIDTSTIMEIGVQAEIHSPYVSIDVNHGWNLLSNPMTVTNDSVHSLFPSSFFSHGYAFHPTTGYHQSSTMMNGIGYWLKFGDTARTVIAGEIRTVDSLTVSPGWNLIGTISSPVAVDSIIQVPVGVVASGYFGYAGSYSPVDTLFPGTAYWVKAILQGVLVLR